VPFVGPDGRSLAQALRGLAANAPWLALALLCVACAARQPSGAGTAAMRRVVLFPLNVVVNLPSDVESGVRPVAEELEAFVRAHRLEIQTLAFAQARDEWLRSALALKREVGSEKMDFEGAARTLARRLSEAQRFDALILPWIAMRAARMQGATISWDGVKRKLRLTPTEGRNRGKWALGSFRMQVQAPSLQVAVFSPAGQKLFEGVGGLDLVEDADLEVTAARIHFEMTPRPAIFEDRALLREGIETAFDPFLPPLDDEEGS